MFWRIGAGLISGSLLASLALLRENTLPELKIYQEIQFLEMGIDFRSEMEFWGLGLFGNQNLISQSFLRAECFLGMVNSVGLAFGLMQ